MKSRLTILFLAAFACVHSFAAAKARKPVAPKSADELLAGATKVWSQDFESFAVGASPYAAKCGTNDCFGVSDWRACSGEKALLVEPSFASAQPNPWSWSVADFGGKFPKTMRGHVVVRFCYFCDSPMSSWTASGFTVGFAGEQYSSVKVALGGESNVSCHPKTASGGIQPKNNTDKLYPVQFGLPTQTAYRWYRYTVKVPVGRTPDGNVSAAMERLGLDGKWEFVGSGCLSSPEKYTQPAKADLTLSGPASARWGSQYRAFVDDLEVSVAKEAGASSVGPREDDIISLDE